MFIKEYDSERLSLKILGPEHADLVLDYYYRNKDFFVEWDPEREDDFYTKSNQADQLKYELSEYKKGNFFRLWIFKKLDDSKTIGNICFSNIIYGNFRSCFLGYKLDIMEINKGYMTEAIQRGIQIVFDEFGLHRIEVNIMPRNIKSLRVAEKLGLEKEGFSKSYLYINKKWEDHYHFATYNDDEMDYFD
ncbi:MAG: GCN5-related N-acetyltransferase [Clostridiales bacterium 38_11]|nr:MAG: GCN5-related N-acetyltransferase [Clostridiales bacterium 38_11]HBH13616.1 30S ribosomal protein S5 alanine N-acetyltransferase [Clostridiales bacterium]